MITFGFGAAGRDKAVEGLDAALSAVARASSMAMFGLPVVGIVIGWRLAQKWGAAVGGASVALAIGLPSSLVHDGGFWPALPLAVIPFFWFMMGLSATRLPNELPSWALSKARAHQQVGS
jgi:hypothetical protein